MEKLKGIVRSVSDPKEWNGIMQIGFTLEAEPKKWYNVDADSEEVLIDLKKEVVSRGNTIEFELDKGKVGNITLKEKAKPKEKSWADDMTNFEDLLQAAHDKGLISISTEMISVDFEKKTAVFKATVKGQIGICKDCKEIAIGEFSGHGDAEGIGTETIKPHFMRMAETRAIARALRWYTNNAEVTDVETGGEKSDNPPKKQNETDNKKRG